MKYRQGFVTNSSSSSFVIAIKDRSEPFNRAFIDAFIKTTGDETRIGQFISTKEELDAEYKGYCWGSLNTLEKLFEEETELKETYDKTLQLINDGYAIIKKSISYSDEGFSDFVYQLAKASPEDVIILNND